MVTAVAELLADEGYAVVRYDARGAGESEGSASWTCVFFQLRVFLHPLSLVEEQRSD